MAAQAKENGNKDKRLICLGRIRGAHGLNGAVRLLSFTEQAEDIARYGPLSDAGGQRQFEITALRRAKKDLVAHLKGVVSRDDAEALKGVELFVERARLGQPHEADEDTWLYADLIGLEAVYRDGTPFGRITAVQNFGACDLLDIRRTPGRKGARDGAQSGGDSVFIPFTREAVPEVNIREGWVIIVPPEGLLEETQPPETQLHESDSNT